MTANPLWTADQAAVEKLALRLIDRPDVRAAREAEWRKALSDPLTATQDGRALLDRALDQWVLGIAMREANFDPADPKVVWNISNAPRNWHGHVYQGAAVAIDNPDNFNREIPIALDGHYEIDIRFSENPPQFSILMEVEPDHHAGLGRNIGTFTLQDLLPAADATRKVTVTVGPEARDGLHLQTQPGELGVYCRDSQINWSQVPATITVRRLDRPANWQPRRENEIAAKVIADIPAWVGFWRGFKDGFLGHPEPNRLIGPNGRDGGWGYLAGGRFRLSDDQAMVITLDPAGSYYTGFQISDPWTISPDPMLRVVSLNKSQAAPNPDGTVTYVLASIDPGIVNWIDTAGLREGWMLTRWQGVPPDADTTRFIREVRMVPATRVEYEVSAGTPRIDLAGRRAQIAERVRQHALRTGGADWA